MEKVVRQVRSKAEREAFYKLTREFWGGGKKPELGRMEEWKLFNRKLMVIDQAIKNGTIDVDDLLNKYNLVKFL